MEIKPRVVSLPTDAKRLIRGFTVWWSNYHQWNQLMGEESLLTWTISQVCIANFRFLPKLDPLLPSQFLCHVRIHHYRYGTSPAGTGFRAKWPQTALEYEFDLYKSTFQGKERRKEFHDLYHDVFVEVAFGNWVNSATLPLLLHQKVMVYNYANWRTVGQATEEFVAFLFERQAGFVSSKMAKGSLWRKWSFQNDRTI